MEGKSYTYDTIVLLNKGNRMQFSLLSAETWLIIAHWRQLMNYANWSRL